jgi:hypothetical protein
VAVTRDAFYATRNAGIIVSVPALLSLPVKPIGLMIIARGDQIGIRYP